MISTIDSYGWEDVGSAEFGTETKLNALIQGLADLMQVKFEALAAEPITAGQLFARRSSDGKLVVADARYKDRTPPCGLAEQDITAGELVPYVARGQYRALDTYAIWHSNPSWLTTRDLYLWTDGAMGPWSGVPPDGTFHYVGRVVQDFSGDPLLLFNPMQEPGHQRRGSMTKVANLAPEYFPGLESVAYSTVQIYGGGYIYAPTTNTDQIKPGGLLVHCDHGMRKYDILGVATYLSIPVGGFAAVHDMNFADAALSAPVALASVTAQTMIDAVDWSEGYDSHGINPLALDISETTVDRISWYSTLNPEAGSSDYGVPVGNHFIHSLSRTETPVGIGTVGIVGTVWFQLGDLNPIDE